VQFELSTNAPYNCVTVNSSATAQGTPVISYSCGAIPAQLWTYVEGEIYGIGTQNGNYTCLTSTGTTPGSRVVLDSCTGAETQAWYFQNAGLGSPVANQVINRAGSLCLDSAGPTVNDALRLVVNACNESSTQSWIVR
jgi:hypothetical protein